MGDIGVFRVWLAWFALDALPEAGREGNGQLRAGRSIGPILGSTPAEIDAGIEHDDFRWEFLSVAESAEASILVFFVITDHVFVDVRDDNSVRPRGARLSLDRSPPTKVAEVRAERHLRFARVPQAHILVSAGEQRLIPLNALRVMYNIHVHCRYHPFYNAVRDDEGAKR